MLKRLVFGTLVAGLLSFATPLVAGQINQIINYDAPFDWGAGKVVFTINGNVIFEGGGRQLVGKMVLKNIANEGGVWELWVSPDPGLQMPAQKVVRISTKGYQFFVPRVE